jgi:hypothetical protein
VCPSSEKSVCSSGSHQCKCRVTIVFLDAYSFPISSKHLSQTLSRQHLRVTTTPYTLGSDHNDTSDHAPSKTISKMTTSIPPLVLSPANIWAGNDGNWSTWAVKVGSSLQNFHILPSASHGEVWVPGLQGCTRRHAEPRIPRECVEYLEADWDL